MTRVDFHARNAVGTTIATFDNQERAKAWVKEHIARFPTLRVVRVSATIIEEVVYRPREVMA